MSQWIRFWDHVLDDPQLQTMPAERFRILTNCWLWAARTNNDLGTIAEMSWRLRLESGVAEGHMAELIAVGLLISTDGRLSVKDWEEWQYDTDGRADYMRNWRAKKKSDRNESVNHAKSRVTITRESRDVTRDVTRESRTVTRNSHALNPEKRREEEKREDDVAAVAATAPEARPQQQRFDDLPEGPDPSQLVADACEMVTRCWPNLGSVPNAKRAWEREAAGAVEGVAEWCRKIQQTALIHAMAHAECRKANPRHFVPTLERWVVDGDYARKPPETPPKRQGMTRLIDMFPEANNAS
jgi:hypothetical protein